jgi:hypothetical protein
LSTENNDTARNDPSILGRVGCWISDGVRVRTTIALLRLRHQLLSRRQRHETLLMVEEATALAWVGGGTAGQLAGTEALSVLSLPPVDDPPRHVREREVMRALALTEERTSDLEAFVTARARALAEDHMRVREASRGAGTTSVQAFPRPDIIGVYVLLPRIS